MSAHESRAGAQNSLTAALYLRVSTEKQNYSTQHQRAAIVGFAAENGLALVREYIDEGRSGLDIRRRQGLQDLIKDVQSGAADFTTIIVYDVSRWGRFQDVDEAAYYEHMCRRAGIRVMYCAEQFENDGSPLSALLKGIKRTMAAEYSRELSAKVFRAQCRFIDMGFKQGGHAGYGLRRQAVSADGVIRRELQLGEAKSVTTDRVVLVRGPEHEVATVLRIYAAYVDDKASDASIARMLNSEGVASEFGRPWTFSMVNSVLTNVKYIGTLAYNRRSSKLSTLRARNLVADWVRNDDAVPALISLELFASAQAERARRNRRYSHVELLSLLRDCYARHGRVTATVIAGDTLLPDPQLFVRSFGSLMTAYDKAGLTRTSTHAFIETRHALAFHRDRLVEQSISLARVAGATAEYGNIPGRVVINQALQVQISAIPRWQPKKGRAKWIVRKWPGVDFHIVARHVPDGRLLDFFLLPAESFGRSGKIFLKGDDCNEQSGCRFTELSDMFGKP